MEVEQVHNFQFWSCKDMSLHISENDRILKEEKLKIVNMFRNISSYAIIELNDHKQLAKV